LAEPHPLADPPSEQQDSGDTQTTTLSDVQLHPVPEPDLPQVHFLA
jgi:hypothetical protein